MLRTLLVPVCLLVACGGRVKEDVPVAGVAEAAIDLPVGTPMAGYTARLLGSGRPDSRSTPFTTGFAPTAGIQTRPAVKVIWLHNNDHHMVLAKVDLCYLADHVVEDVEAALSEALDQDMGGQVMIAASHTHQGWGGWNAHYPYFLGGDRHHPELDVRLVDSITKTALTAWESREPVALGVGWAKDWDPDDRIYRDRRNINNDLNMWGEPGEAAGKDPYLHVLRVDRTDGTPLAMAVTFGIHGIAVGEDSPMLSTEASGQIENAVQEQFDSPVLVMHLQGSGGDASPAGSGGRFDRLEDVGRKAVGPIMELYQDTPTSDAAVTIETSNGHEPQSLGDITITREGTVDWQYVQGVVPDGVIYAEDGSLLSPFDEFNAPNGAVFCGDERPQLPLPTVGSETYPYTSCVRADGMLKFLETSFDLPEESVPLPLPPSTVARTAAIQVGPLPVRDVDGTVSDQLIMGGFFPGEPTAVYGEQFRRRASESLGTERAWLIGYAQDHEGYLLVPEDWLLGGYEPNINQWGPLQGEYLMERMLNRAAEELGDGKHQKWKPESPTPTGYDRTFVATEVPERSPDAGQRLDAAPEMPLWTPDEMVVDLNIPATLPRVQGLIQMAWIGGDPRVDTPVVELQRQDGSDWVPVRTQGGRVLNDTFGDILLTWTPDPLREDVGPRTHRWWASWQAVSHFHDPAGMPLGTYRLAASGKSWTGSEDIWPWTTEDYQVSSEPFEIVPATITVSPTAGGYFASLEGPEDGYRQVALGGNAQGNNALTEPIIVTVDGVIVDAVVSVDSDRTRIEIAEGDVVRVEDAYGNVGEWVR
ncbi:MAG: hypothetical protein AB8H79_04040 [Myxococcota bacterium]